MAQSAANTTEITVYNQGFGFVKELRDISLISGRQTIKVEDVASMIDPSSVGIRSITDPNSFEVLEQNYQYDLISPQAILNKSVGKKIRVIRTIGNQRDIVEGVLLSAPNSVVGTADGSNQYTCNGMVLRTDDGRIVLDPKGEIEVQQVPDGLISTPTLLWDLNAAKAGPNTFELSYITQGMSWNADYVLTLGPTDRDADLKGWVTLTNNSGATYKGAKLKLLAGDVNQAQPVNAPVMFKATAAGEASDRSSFKEEGLFEYHLYTLQRPATIANREIKQLSLLEAKGIQVQKRLIFDSMRGYNVWYPNEGEVGTGDLKPQVRVEFVNKQENQLGIPLPKGRFRIYKRDNSGSVQMLGEDTINHTPKNEKVSLVVGRAFDVVGNRKRTNFTRLAQNRVQESYEIEVRNRNDTPETVTVIERHWGDWQVTDKNADFTKEDSNTMQFVLNLKANEVRKITYTVMTKW